jgi:hypothetical protein
MAALEASARQRSSRGESVLAPTLVRRLIAAYPRRLASHKAARPRPQPRGGTGRSVTSRRPRHIGTDSQWAGRHSQSDTRPDSTTLRGIATSRCPAGRSGRARADAAAALGSYTGWLTQDVGRRGQSSVSSDRCPRAALIRTPGSRLCPDVAQRPTGTDLDANGSGHGPRTHLRLTVSFQAVDFHVEIAVGQPLGQ